MSEGYQFQVNVWQPSPDTKPVVERHVVHGRVVELGPSWVAEQLPRVADPNAPVEDGRQRVATHARNRRMPIEIAACWQHIGFAACYGEHEAKYDLSRCREIFNWLGLDETKPTSHGTRRPACMVGAIAAYLDRYPSAFTVNIVRNWCDEYKMHCCAKGKRTTLATVSGLYQRIGMRNSTEGKEKTRVFFNTHMALKAYCKGHSEIAFSDPPESVLALIDPVKAK